MKIGILTHYYKSKNYGGNLQAYAMCKAIHKYGYEVEQLCVPILPPKQKIFRKIIISIKTKIVYYYDVILHIQYHRKYNERKKAMREFNTNVISHSQNKYSERNIKKALSNYQAFITGSDIVWGPKVHSSLFFLNFVPLNMPKFSYAASLGTNKLTENEKAIFHKDLRNYQAISVREKSVIPILSEVTSAVIEHCVDPTLLLTQNDWNEICTDRMISQEYLFCYFLGSNDASRRAAEEYAKKNGLKVVTIPYLLNKYRECDYDFGDIKLSKVSPVDFISLIKYADCVFTDSFHACVFSYLYKKEVYAFRRDKNDNMGVRVKDFLELVNLSSHYCNSDEKETLSYIEIQQPSNILYDDTKINDLIEKSKDYLIRNLKLAEETVKRNEEKR